MGIVAERDRITAAHVRDRQQAAAAGGPPLIGVSVPATSANLGPGYDSFGVALDVPLVAVVLPRGDHRIIAHGEGAAELSTGDDNLVWRAVKAWCVFAGTSIPEISVQVDTAIPLERGMGSSSAAAVAGLLLGRALTGGQATIQQMLGLATDLEGHADNAAAALVGGLVACTPDGRFVRVTPSSALRPVLLVPHQRQSTTQSRAGLPRQVSLAAAAANLAHAATTFAGLAGLIPLTAGDMVDVLHEPVRLQVMPSSQALLNTLRGAGIPTALSGAGPSIVAVIGARDTAAVDTVRTLASNAVPQAGAVEVIPASWDLAGATVCPPGPTTQPDTNA
ncbi:MAG: homoserine kinase [Euzebya sp.]